MARCHCTNPLCAVKRSHAAASAAKTTPPRPSFPPSFRPEVLQPDCGAGHEVEQLEREQRRDPPQADRHQQGRAIVEAAEGERGAGADRAREQLLAQAQRVLFRPGAGRPALQHGRPREGEPQRPLRADADAVGALHAPGIDDHPVAAHLLVDQDVGAARGGAVPALLAVLVHDDPADREPVRGAEQRAVRAAVRAEPLGAQEVDGREAAGEDRQDREQRPREGPPVVGRDEVVGEAGERSGGIRKSRRRRVGQRNM